MGRSVTSCFKIITCSGSTVDKDDLRATEGKGSSDKSRWSFHRRSASHQVLSNTVVSETASVNKESSESTNVLLQIPDNSSIPEKNSTTQWMVEKPQLPPLADLKTSKTIAAGEDVSKVDITMDESVIVIMQSAIRGFLAQRTLLRNKKIVKLQAAVRGHLVRNHAVGTLRCFQAIVKMQALVRARRARLSREGSSTEEKLHGNPRSKNCSSNILGKENSGNKPVAINTSIEKLHSNRFASQLLESTQGTKTMKIKCDPLKPDSAWKWLERWMSVLEREIEQSENFETSTGHDKLEKVELSDAQVETLIQSEGCKSTELKSSSVAASVPSENEENLITHDSDKIDFQTSDLASLSVTHNEVPQPERVGTESPKENSLNLLPSEIKQTDLTSKIEPSHISGTPEMESEQSETFVERFAPEQLETEGKKFVFGSRRASNPAFIAAQSKFEELSSTANSTRLNTSYNQDTGVESNANVASLPTNKDFQKREIGLTELSISCTLGVQISGSGCGTGLSVPSTLDMPEIPEVGVMEFDQDAKASLYKISNHKSSENLDVEAKGESDFSGSDLPHPIQFQPERSEDGTCANVEPDSSVITVDYSEGRQKPEKNAYNLQIEESERGQQEYKSSPEASPRSHLTIPESLGTPSSQISGKPKRIESGKGGSNKKNASFSAGKKSPSNRNHDSGASSLQQLPEDHKTGKQHNSFGSARPDHVDHEPRDSSSSSSLPNYMQATESARAKALANSSPRSSPDVREKAIKKRHSLPGANGKQGSPRIQLSMSQAQQSAKGNGTHSHEKKWQR